MVKRGLGVGFGATLRVDEFLAASLVGSVPVVKCTMNIILPVLFLEGCGMDVEVVRMSIVGCLLVSVLAEGSPLSVDCSIVVVDVGVVCSVASVLLVVVVVWRVGCVEV